MPLFLCYVSIFFSSQTVINYLMYFKKNVDFFLNFIFVNFILMHFSLNLLFYREECFKIVTETPVRID